MRPLNLLSAGRRCLLSISKSQYTAATSQVSQQPALLRSPCLPTSCVRNFSVSSVAELKKTQMPSRPKPPPEDELDEMFVKGTGPGGQKINKTNSAVQIRHKPTGIVVKSQATRSRSQNRAIARNILAAKLDELNNGEQSRTAIVAASKFKKKANAMKKSKRKYRKLEEEKGDKGEAVETAEVKVDKTTVLAAGAAAFMASESVPIESSDVLTDSDILQRVAELRATDRYEGMEEHEDDEVDVVIEEEDEDEEEEEEDEDYEEEEDEDEEDSGEEVWKVDEEPSRTDVKAKVDR